MKIVMVGLVTAALLTRGLSAQPADPKKPAEPIATPEKSGTPKKESTPLTPKALLDAVKAKYAKAKTYRDEGNVHQEFSGPASHKNDLPFSTAFERDGRFLWQFAQSPQPGRGKPSMRYVVWSKDNKAFHTWWDVTKESEDFESYDMAMAGPTGVSGGSAMAVCPLLRGLASVSLPQTPADDGTEKLDGVECRKVTGTGFGGSKITLWIDPTPAIRKVVEKKEIDPGKLAPEGAPTGKFTVETTITFKPTFDEKIPDEAFDPKTPAPNKPAGTP